MWLWDSWTDPQTLPMTGMTPGSRVHPVLRVVGTLGPVREGWASSREGLPQCCPSCPPPPWCCLGSHLGTWVFSGRRTLWLDIRGKEAAALSLFHVSMPLPGVSCGVGQGCSLASLWGPAPGVHLFFLMGLSVWLPTRDREVGDPRLKGWSYAAVLPADNGSIPELCPGPRAAPGLWLPA